MVHFYSTTIIGRHKGNDHLRAALQGYSKVHFFPSPPLGKGEKVGHPTPRQGAAAPWIPALQCAWSRGDMIVIRLILRVIRALPLGRHQALPPARGELGIGRSEAHPFALDLPPSLLLQILEDACGPHATADTHRHHTVASFAPLHLMHELDGELRAGGSHGVTKCDGTAVHVHLLKV